MFKNVSITATFVLFGHDRKTVIQIDNWHNVYQFNDRQIHPAAHLKEVAMQVGDILRKKTARVATVRMNETVGIAAQLMRASNIRALVVKDVVRTEGNTAVGMFTERDRRRRNKNHIRHLPVIDDYSLIGVISIRDISSAVDDAATAAAA